MYEELLVKTEELDKPEEGIQKFKELLLVGIANILDTQVLQNGTAICTAVIFFYLANEGISITILSALAQDESRSISDNIRWSIQKKFQRGEAMVDLTVAERINGKHFVETMSVEFLEFLTDCYRVVYY